MHAHTIGSADRPGKADSYPYSKQIAGIDSLSVFDGLNFRPLQLRILLLLDCFGAVLVTVML